MTQQGETPNGGQPFSMADMVGFMMRDLFSHGINMEEHLMQARQGAQNLGLQLQMAHRAMDEGERTIGERNERINQLEGLLEEAYALLGQGFCFGSAGITSEWQQRVEVWDQRFRAAVSDWPHHLTDTPALPDAYTDPEEEPGA